MIYFRKFEFNNQMLMQGRMYDRSQHTDYLSLDKLVPKRGLFVEIWEYLNVGSRPRTPELAP